MLGQKSVQIPSAEAMLRALIDGHQTALDSIQAAADVATDNEDNATLDLLTQGALSDPLRALYGRDVFNAALPSLIGMIWRECVCDGPGAAQLKHTLPRNLGRILARRLAPIEPKSEAEDAPHRRAGNIERQRRAP